MNYRSNGSRWCVLVERTVTVSAIIEVDATGPEEAKERATTHAMQADPMMTIGWEQDSESVGAAWAIDATELAGRLSDMVTEKLGEAGS